MSKRGGVSRKVGVVVESVEMAMTSDYIFLFHVTFPFFFGGLFKEMKHQFLFRRFEPLHHLFGGCIPDRNGTRCLQIISKSIGKRRKIGGKFGEERWEFHARLYWEGS